MGPLCCRRHFVSVWTHASDLVVAHSASASQIFIVDHVPGFIFILSHCHLASSNKLLLSPAGVWPQGSVLQPSPLLTLSCPPASPCPPPVLFCSLAVPFLPSPAFSLPFLSPIPCPSPVPCCPLLSLSYTLSSPPIPPVPALYEWLPPSACCPVCTASTTWDGGSSWYPQASRFPAVQTE